MSKQTIKCEHLFGRANDEMYHQCQLCGSWISSEDLLNYHAHNAKDFKVLSPEKGRKTIKEIQSAFAKIWLGLSKSKDDSVKWVSPKDFNDGKTSSKDGMSE